MSLFEKPLRASANELISSSGSKAIIGWGIEFDDWVNGVGDAAPKMGGGAVDLELEVVWESPEMRAEYLG